MNKTQTLSEKLELHFNETYFHNPHVSSETREALFMSKIAKMEATIEMLKGNKKTIDLMLLDIFHTLGKCVDSHPFMTTFNYTNIDMGIMEDVKIYLEDEELI